MNAEPRSRTPVLLWLALAAVLQETGSLARGAGGRWQAGEAGAMTH